LHKVCQSSDQSAGCDHEPNVGFDLDQQCVELVFDSVTVVIS
jgi:hypothetical protein